MVNYLRKEYNYYSERSVPELRSDIQQLFDEYRGVNLKGEFTSESEFNMTPLWQVIPIRFFENELCFLRGRIYKDEQKRTRVTFTVRGNSIFTLFLFLFPAIGLDTWYTNRPLPANDKLYNIIYTFVFIVPAIMLLMTYLTKRSTRNTFIKYFELKKVP